MAQGKSNTSNLSSNEHVSGTVKKASKVCISQFGNGQGLHIGI